MSIAAFHLSSGVLLLATVEHEGDEDFLVKDPLQLSIRDGSEVGFYLVRYMPFNEDKMVLLKKTSIQSLSTTNATIAKMYTGFLTKDMKVEEDTESLSQSVMNIESTSVH